MTSDIAFAEHIDRATRSYATSAGYRAALHAEAPHAPIGVHGICPPEHPHGVTRTCYSNHKCRCPECREASARYQKQGRALRKVLADRRAAAQRIA